MRLLTGPRQDVDPSREHVLPYRATLVQVEREVERILNPQENDLTAWRVHALRSQCDAIVMWYIVSSDIRAEAISHLLKQYNKLTTMHHHLPANCILRAIVALQSGSKALLCEGCNTKEEVTHHCAKQCTVKGVREHRPCECVACNQASDPSNGT